MTYWCKKYFDIDKKLPKKTMEPVASLV